MSKIYVIVEKCHKHVLRKDGVSKLRPHSTTNMRPLVPENVLESDQIPGADE